MSKKVVERLKAQFAGKILETSDFRGDDTVVVAKADWALVGKFLRDDAECAMDMPVDFTAVDYPDRAQRFEVIFMVRSLSKNHRLRMKTRVAEGEKVPTLIDTWEGVNWPEREVFDMFGITFEGHPDLRRILMYPEFVGHPLLKDYPAQKTQPLVPYRTEEEAGQPLNKLAPFREDEGMSFGRKEWSPKTENS